MDQKEPKRTPEPVHEEQPRAEEGVMAVLTRAEDPALARTVAAIASAVSELVDPASAATLREAAADLMKGAEDGNA